MSNNADFFLMEFKVTVIPSQPENQANFKMSAVLEAERLNVHCNVYSMLYHKIGSDGKGKVEV